jgi:hypothetical protein
MNANPVHLYFHSPCFDGIVSAAIASDYLEQVKGFPQTQLHAANYHLRDQWLGTELSRPAAVVDFLYHPGAKFWVDHHSTAFLSDETRRDYEERRGSDILYDHSASSCAVLIWKHWGEVLPRPAAHYKTLVEWADRIDSARYESVDEAVGLEAPAMQINLALAMYKGDAFSQHLVWLFRTEPIESVAKRTEVHAAFVRGRHLQRLGQERLGASMRLTADGIVVFDVDAQEVLVNRYAPFRFFPQARYSVGIVRSPGRSKLTAMRNPWIEFPSAPLGELCVSLGGGGHRRVGSVLVRDKDPAELLSQLVRMISAHEEKQEDMVAA